MPQPIQTALTRAISQSNNSRAVPRARAALDEAASQLATGYRIQRPSDDPAGFSQARTIGRIQDRLAQHGRAIDAAALWIDRTQTELDGLADLFSEAKEIGVRAANGLLDADDFARSIEAIREEAISRLNATSNGEYLFAGNQTKTAPLNADGTIAAGDFSGLRQREVAPGLTLDINTVGALDVDGVPAPQRLQDLADAIRAGDSDAMTTALDGVQTSLEHYIRLGGQNGIKTQRLQSARDAIDAQNLVLDERRATIEEIDLAEVMGLVQQRQTSLEAALRAQAASVQTTLLNYLN